MDAYRIYNRDLHAAITEAARNTCLSSAMGQLTLQKAEAQALIERHILGALGDIVCFGLSAPA
jgi:DNA-binding GntR family transcriptional regulator